jgi:transposase-like protein
MDQRREHDPELDRDWEEAVEEAHRGLSGATGPFDCPQGGRLKMIKRGKRGRLQLVSPGENRWNAAVERRFLDALRVCGNVSAAARAVGFSDGTIWERRRKWPAFAKALDELLEEVELALEFRLGCQGSDVVPAQGEEPGASESLVPVESGPFDPEAAMRFLKWREEKRRGRGRRTPPAKPPTIEEVTEKIVRRVEAIKRHKARGGRPPDAA